MENISNKDIENVVLRIIEKVSNTDQQFDLDTTLTELRINSVKIIQIIAMLESELDFELNEEDLVMANFATARSTIFLLRDRYCEEAAA